jgi:hypothetical protein
MGTAATPTLEAGRVYRTRDLAAWSANPPRLAKRLVRDGLLMPLAHGLFAHPKKSRFGSVPPTDQELMRAFLDGASFVFTGPEKWNALGLGSTAVFATPLVYNTKRSGPFTFGGGSFQLRRVAFPESPPPEWFVVDLFENADRAGASKTELAAALARALRRGAFSRERLDEMTKKFASKGTASLVRTALGESRA